MQRIIPRAHRIDAKVALHDGHDTGSRREMSQTSHRTVELASDRKGREQRTGSTSSTSRGRRGTGEGRLEAYAAREGTHMYLESAIRSI